MTFANPWGLLALLALPTILAIHLYRRRYPALKIAGLHLWSSEKRENPAGRKRDQLPFSLSLLLELLAALLLALVLSDPRFGELEDARHLIVVLDSSASMQSRPPRAGSSSFRENAVRELERRAAHMPRGSRFTILLTGLRPVVLAGPAVPWPDAVRLVETWQPALPRHSFEPAWESAVQLSEQSGGNILFITDRMLPDKDLPPQLEVVAVGESLANVGISAANWTFLPEKGEGRIFIQAQNHSPQPASATIIGTQAGREVFRRRAELGAKAAASLEIVVPGGLRQLSVAVESKEDGLALDNVIELVEPRVRAVGIAITVSQERTRKLLQRAVSAIPHVNLVSLEEADLVFANASALPTTSTRAWWLGIGPLAFSEVDRKAARNLSGPYLLDQRHSLLEGLTLGGVLWAGVQPQSLDCVPLISAGKYTLLGQLSRRRNFAGILNIDLERSNLGETPDWPILVQNLVEMRRGDLPGLLRNNFHLGEEIQFRLYEDPAEPAAQKANPLQLKQGETVRPVARAALLELPELSLPGVYSVTDGDMEVARFALNFQDAEESNLNLLSAGLREAPAPPTIQKMKVDSPYTWALLVGLLLITAAIVANWYTLKIQERRSASVA